MARTKRGRGAEAMTAPPAIAVEAVNKSFDGDQVLHDVSLTVEPGRTLVVMGPSGVGKTTLVRIMLGLLDADDSSGGVTIGSQDVLEASANELQVLRRGMGVLLGGNSIYEGSIFSSMTTWSNLRYPLEMRGHDEAAIDERAGQRMVEFELTEQAHIHPPELSAGTRRRLALAKAFVEDPPLLVLDDPGAAMDLQNRKQIISSIRRARENTSATVVLTCHDIEMAKALGDDMVVLLAGKVVATGTVAELLDGVVDADTYDARFGVRDSFAVTDHRDRSTYHRVLDDRREATSWAWAVYLVLGIMAVATFVALLTGVIDNPIHW